MVRFLVLALMIQVFVGRAAADALPNDPWHEVHIERFGGYVEINHQFVSSRELRNGVCIVKFTIFRREVFDPELKAEYDKNRMPGGIVDEGAWFGQRGQAARFWKPDMGCEGEWQKHEFVALDATEDVSADLLARLRSLYQSVLGSNELDQFLRHGVDWRKLLASDDQVLAALHDDRLFRIRYSKNADGTMEANFHFGIDPDTPRFFEPVTTVSLTVQEVAGSHKFKLDVYAP